MSYYFNAIIREKTFEEVIDQVTNELQKEGFGIITEIDITKTFKKKLDVDYRKYKILGACNPNFAHQALEYESKIGVFLPCNVIVDEIENGIIEVSVVDPIASMISVNDTNLETLATDVQRKLNNVINCLK